MTRLGVRTIPLLVSVNRDNNDTPLCQQICHSLRNAILERRWPSDFRLPASRVFAHELGVSRATVLAAYDQLKAEGYIESRGSGGTRVSARAPRATNSLGETSVTPAHNAGLSVLGERMVATYGHVEPYLSPTRPIPFALGAPALDAFPVATWARLTARRWKETPGIMLAADDGPGYAPLRKAIAECIVAARGLRCTPNQIIVTAGTQHAIDLLARLLLNPGDSVWMEAYGYEPARAAFASVAARVVPIPVDADGLLVARGRELAPNARLALVTPASEWPMGVPMGLHRRLELLDWAHESDAWIIEDDFNAELQYQGKQTTALQGLEHPGAGRVIYLRTFTKTLFPALRLGYAVLPYELVDAFARARRVVDRHSPTAEQAVLADFIRAGHFARHVRSLRRLHAERQRDFLELASSELGTALRLRPAPNGLRLVGFLPPHISDRSVTLEAARRGVVVAPLTGHCMSSPEESGLILGYAAFRPQETRRALGQLAEAIRAVERSP
jgi:GntR family transcriptional regulator / MocR family aminotransferase